MSEFTAIREVSRSLRTLLEARLAHEADDQLPDPSVVVALDSPQATAAEFGVSLWLYRVARNPDLANHPPPRPAVGLLGRTPLPLDLYYLVTPMVGDPEADQALLGRVVQTFHDTPVLRGADLSAPLLADGREVRVTLEPQSLDVLTQLWQALQEPYRLSVSYHVQVLPIDSARPPDAVAAVRTREVRTAQILAST
ncbi:MAG TPA: DUF4255 domain-containing protein [Urbifossiella sp.]|nr:DUF4255 domain-containing protein [Urbifossiella sp.]